MVILYVVNPYAAIRRSEDDFPLPTGDPAMTNSYMGLAYDIERNGLEDKAYPAVRRYVQDIGKASDIKFPIYFIAIVLVAKLSSEKILIFSRCDGRIKY